MELVSRAGGARAEARPMQMPAASVNMAGPAPAIELVLTSGLMVRVPPGFDPATLRQVVEALS